MVIKAASGFPIPGTLDDNNPNAVSILTSTYECRNPVTVGVIAVPGPPDSRKIAGQRARDMSSSCKIRSRLIEEDDLHEVANLLARGLGYPREYFDRLFETLRDHPTPDGFPKYGCVLTNGSTIVGAIVLIFSVHPSGSTAIRCHVTSWYVEHAFRAHSTLFFGHALKHDNVTYLNVSARPGSVPIIKVQGFLPYSKGQFVTVPALRFYSKLSRGVPQRGTRDIPDAEYDPADRKVLLDHQRYGNICFWCVEGGKAYPFVFQPRLFKGILPGAQLVYCRDIVDVVRFIGPIGRTLFWRGLVLLRMDANGSVRGLPGLYFSGMEPRYYKGSEPPRVGDLTYTQTVMLPFARKSSVSLVQRDDGAP